MSNTDRQSSYTPKKETSQFNTYIETPLSIGISLDFHTITRSERLVDKLKNVDIEISYDKLLSIENCLAGHVIEETKRNHGIYLHPWTIPDKFTWFAIDNIDFLENTPSGMNTLHGTAISIYQEKKHNESSKERIFDRKMNLKDVYDDCEMPILKCNYPKPKKNTRHNVTLNESKPSMIEKRKLDLAWITATVGCLHADFNKEVTSNKFKTPGTWTAFNSLTGTYNERTTNIAVLTPLIRSPPTDISTLFTAITRTGNITKQVRLWVVNEEIRNNYIFRPGELHVTFWALAALGKYIEASGVIFFMYGLKNSSGETILQGPRSSYVNFINTLSTVF